MLKELWHDKRSEGYADVAISLLILIVFVVSLTALAPIFTTQINLNATVDHVARYLELEGKADDATLTKALSGCYAPDDITVTANWNNAAKKTIQIKEKFKVNATKTITLTFFRPAVSSPIGIDLQITANSTGVSEVYWKK